MRFILAAMMLAFFASGAFVLAVSIRELLRKFSRRHRFERTEGVVMNVRRKTVWTTSQRRVKPLVMNFPVVRFTTRAGETRTFTSEMGDTGNVSRYSAGKRLPVCYDPRGEFAPMIDTWAGIWLPNLMAMLAGVGFLFGAVLIGWAFGDRLLGH